MPQKAARLLSVALALALVGTPVLTAAQDQKPKEPKAQPPAATSSTNEASTAAPETDQSTVTHHALELNGKTIRYTATAGNLIIRDKDNKPNGSLFYVAYTEDGVEARNRPLTFLYNGGPGSSSLWLHMGSFGPVRIETSSPDATPPAPYDLVANQYSLLDVTDLVFIDAMGTGYSRPIENGHLKDFLGVDQDVLAFNKFITRYLMVNQRWNSPKFLLGESYGTTRSAALAYSLQQSGIALNGVVLISSILNYNDAAPGTDIQYIGFLPSFAAIAWYHNKLANKPADLQAFLTQVRAYARGPYAEALWQGQNLSPTEEDQVAKKLSQFTGLSAQYWKNANLRVTASNFRKELLRGDRRILGRYDARFEGTDMKAIGSVPDYDPSDSGISGAFVAALHEYLATDLKFRSDLEYKATAFGPGFKWDQKHRAPDGEQQQLPDVVLDLGATIRENPNLKVFCANGYFDLATPFFKTEFDVAQMQLAPGLRKNIQFAYYPSGHMIYLNVNALKQLKADLAEFYQAATKKP